MVRRTETEVGRGVTDPKQVGGCPGWVSTCGRRGSRKYERSWIGTGNVNFLLDGPKTRKPSIKKRIVKYIYKEVT